MIELLRDQLSFSFSQIHPDATLTIQFQRTLRIPDNSRDYPLPPGLGCFPLRHVDDFGTRVPSAWIEHGGVMLPMYQSEAMWLNFDAGYCAERDVLYPLATKIATGKINSISGLPWTAGLIRDPQNYAVVPGQPWLDGYCVEKGIIRQFVAMPLGAGYTAEEQLTGTPEHGGIQISVFPMKREVFERRFPKREKSRVLEIDSQPMVAMMLGSAGSYSMGLAPGGRMKQEIYKDPYDLSDWDTENGARCFAHIANSLVWSQITGEDPPTVPPTSEEYARYGLPWFLWYEDKLEALSGSDKLKDLKSIETLGKEKKDVPLPENQSVSTQNIIVLRNGLKRNQVREFAD
jgi:hypothetical protein